MDQKEVQDAPNMRIFQIEKSSFFVGFSNENEVQEDFGGSMAPGIRAIEASKITLATFGAIMGAFGVSVWLLERSRALFGGPGEPPKGGGRISGPGKTE